MKALIRAVFLAALIAVAGCGGGSKHINSTTNVAFLYVVGQGSNTIQGFHIQASGELSATSQTFFATNARPVAMALHPSTNFLYVANLTANTVSGYNVDHTSGFLTPVGTALAPVPTGPSPIAVGVNSGGQFLFVLNQGDASISVYSIDATRGILTQVGSPPSGLTNPRSLVVSPTAASLYVVSDAGPTDTTSKISGFSIGANGVLTAAGSFTAGANSNISRMTIDPKGQFLYAADSANNNVVSLSISASGALSQVAGSPFTAGTQPFAVAVDASDSFVYVSNSGSNDVSAFKTSAGVLTPITGSPFPTQGSGTVSVTQPGFLIVDATNTFVYVSNVATKAIAAFAINSADGTLVAVNNSPFGQVVTPSWLVSTK
jgi:6-phosphogluconolactonase (cycloisomerase 2 family)